MNNLQRIETEYVLELENYDKSPFEFLDEIKAAVASIPVEFEETASVQVNSEGLMITYTRPETEQELQWRLGREAGYKETRRKQYEQLKKEFEQ